MLKLALLGIAALLVTSTAAFGEYHGQVVDDLRGWLKTSDEKAPKTTVSGTASNSSGEALYGHPKR